MKASELARWWLLFAELAVALPGKRRRQAPTSSDQCTCPANGPVTSTVYQNTIYVYSTTVTADSSTVYSTDSTEVATAIATSTVTVTTDTTTSTFPANTVTTTVSDTTTSTLTTTVTQTTCVASRRVRRQASSASSTSDAGSSSSSSSSSSDTGDSTTASSTTGVPSVITTTATANSKPYNCLCRAVSTTTVFASTSTCSCPETTATTLTVTTGYTSSSTVTLLATGSTVATVTLSTSTITSTSTVTSSVLATVDITQSDSTVTTEDLETVYVTETDTFTTCPSSSSTSSSSTSTSSSAIPSQSGSLSCNATAYLIETTSGLTKLYNIDLQTSNFFTINENVGSGNYASMNGLGFNVLDNFLYAVAQVGTSSSQNWAILRVTATGSVTEVLQFNTGSTSTPGSSGDIDTDGQMWISGSGGTLWRKIDLAPGSSTYGTIVASGSSTLSGYAVYDWTYLPGEGDYLWSLATSTGNSPKLALLRWSRTSHAWSTYANYADSSGTNGIICNWGSNNGTIWGLAATSGSVSRVTIGGTPVAIGSAPSGLTSADGARCALSSN